VLHLEDGVIRSSDNVDDAGAAGDDTPSARLATENGRPA
jgi:hypothetical protein